MPATCVRTPPELKKTKLQVIQTKLLYSFQHSCNGEMHRVSIDRDGRVILHNHEKDEVRNELNLTKLGGTAVGCVRFLHQWASGNVVRSDADRTLSRHVLDRGGLEGMAVGIWHHQNRKRRKEVIQYYDGSKIDKRVLMGDISRRVKDVLVLRGLRANLRFVKGNRDSHLIEIEADNGKRYPVLNASIHGHGYISLNRGEHVGYGSNNVYSILKDEHKKIPITAIADLGERWYYTCYCKDVGKRNRDKDSLPFNVRVDKLHETCTFPTLLVRKDDDHTATVVVNLCVPNMTIQGAGLLVEELNKISDKAKAIIAATEKREQAPHRVPGRIAVGIGNFDAAGEFV